MDKYWDMAEQFSTAPNYQDFEGFANPNEVLVIVDSDAVKDIISCAGDGREKLLRDLVIHYVFTCIDQAEAPTIEVVVEVAAAFGMLVGTRYFMKSDAE